jgi:hypothetical protein
MNENEHDDVIELFAIGGWRVYVSTRAAVGWTQNLEQVFETFDKNGARRYHEMLFRIVGVMWKGEQKAF